MLAKHTDPTLPAEDQEAAGKDRLPANKDVRPALKAPAEGTGRWNDGRPGGGQGRVEITGITPANIRVDPNLCEGHPGYDESGESQVIPADRGLQESSRRTRAVGIASVVFGILGGVFYWWTPLGMVLSLAGLTLGGIAWMQATPRTRCRTLAMTGTFLSAAAFVLDLVIALLGLEWLQLH